MICIAVDPGVNGGIAIMHNNGDVTLQKMPKTMDGMFQLFLSLNGVPYCYMEDVGYHRIGNNAQSSATFARHCGALEVFIRFVAGAVIKPVRPQKWMKLMRELPTGKENVRARKNAIKDRMKRKYPNLAKQITLATADALAILDVMTEEEL